MKINGKEQKEKYNLSDISDSKLRYSFKGKDLKKNDQVLYDTPFGKSLKEYKETIDPDNLTVDVDSEGGAIINASVSDDFNVDILNQLHKANSSNKRLNDEEIAQNLTGIYEDHKEALKTLVSLSENNKDK